MPSVDFNWQEGDEGFESRAEASQPAFEAFAPPRPAPAEPEIEINAQADGEFAAAANPLRLSNLALLLVGVLLGIGVGFFILTVQGQYSARADFAPVVELQHQALAQNDLDLYRSLGDPTDNSWRDLLAEGFPTAKLMYDLDTTPRVRRVRLQGDHAEVEVEYTYQGERYRRLEMMKLVENQWKITRARMGGAWGDLQTSEGDYVTLHYRQRDDFLAGELPQIDAAAQAFCERYTPAPPCHLDLHIVPDLTLLPFIPGEGASPLPPHTRYRIQGKGDTDIVTINGVGNEITDEALQQRLLEELQDVQTINLVYAALSGAPEAKTISAARLYERRIPLQVVSPQLVGLNGDEAHSLWRLALYEAIGDVIMRRALGPITAEDTGAYTAWAAARGDVALWAERLSGAQLPDMLEQASPDPMSIGASLTRGDVWSRNPARDFALYLHTRYGEERVLDLLKDARNHWDADDMFALLETNPSSLAEDWAAWTLAR